MFRRDTVDVGVDYQRIRVCNVYLAGIPGENARHESCVTSLPEINGDLKRRIERVARALALAEAIGILITCSAKIARNLGRVITPEDARRLIKLSHFLRGEQQAARWLRRSCFFLEFYPIKDGAIYEPGSTSEDDLGIASEGAES